MPNGQYLFKVGAYSECCQPLVVFAKSFALDAWQGSEYVYASLI